MCVDQGGAVEPLPASQRGPTDRIHPDELTPTGASSVASVHLPDPTRHPGPWPIVIVCHERYGVVQHTVELAGRFAEEGFVALAPDFYADADLSGHAERLPDVADDQVLRHLDAAIEHARSIRGTDGDAVAVIGICRSGSYGILASATRSDVSAVVMLYGGAQQREFSLSPHRSRPYAELLAAGRCPVLGVWGERDHTMSIDDVRRVRNLLEEARRDYDFLVFEDMPHGWLNDTMPGRFRSAEAEETWRLLCDWLNRQFRSAQPENALSWSFTSRIARDYDFGRNKRLE